MVITVDNFLDDFAKFDEHVRNADFTGVVNPADGVEYPDISVDIPEIVAAEVQQKLSAAMGWNVKVNMQFLRNTSANTDTAPHQAHTDTIQGTHIALLYMQDGFKGAGTSLVKHVDTGLEMDPLTQEDFEIWDRDKNIPEKWKITALLQMKRNRLVCGIWSAYMHRAEPVKGFGESTKDGRVVLITFYERA